MDRNSLKEVSRRETEAFFQWHFGNGYEDEDGSIVLDLVRFANFPQTNEYLREVASGETHTAACGTLWKARLNPQTGEVREMQQVCDRACEFPVVPSHQVAQPWRYTYMAIQPWGTDIRREWFRAIARFDYHTGTLTEADLGENRYVVEPIYARDPEHGDLGWILTVVYDATKDASEVWVFNSDRLDCKPVCRLGLPEAIPISFHGTWNATTTRSK